VGEVGFGPGVKLGVFAVPFLSAGGRAAEVARGVESELLQLDVSVAVPAVFVFAVPQVKDGAGGRGDFALRVGAKTLCVSAELLAVFGVFPEHFVDALGFAVSNGGVCDQVVSAAGQRRIKKPHTQQPSAKP